MISSTSDTMVAAENILTGTENDPRAIHHPPVRRRSIYTATISVTGARVQTIISI